MYWGIHIQQSHLLPELPWLPSLLIFIQRTFDKHILTKATVGKYMNICILTFQK